MSKIYNEETKTNRLIENGVKNGYEWVILSIQGAHPCAYVLIDKNHKYYKKDFENDLEDIVHGGITFSESTLDNIVDEEEEKWIFGWDYAHKGDHTTIKLDPTFLTYGQDWGDPNGKKYTIEEIKEDINSFVEFLES